MKIGLYLDSHPHDGGKFQHSLAVLDAVASLPRDRFDAVIAYLQPHWESYLASYPVRSVHIRHASWKWFFDRIWRNARLPISLWRSICGKAIPSARAFLAEHCSLWVYPTENTLAYQLPVNALATVFDLMHRYEARFPEVAARGRGKRRDRHYRSLCRYSRGVLVDSEIGRQQVVESYSMDRDRIYVLPYVVPRYILAPEQVDVASIYQLPTKYLFYPAQFWEHKNHARLIRAIHLLRKDIPDIRLVLAGSKKNAYGSILTLVKNLHLEDVVMFLGYVADAHMAGLYRRARALVMPTFFGPTNIPPLEAFATGCPVAVSRIYAMPEQLGDAALYFDPLSVGNIADVIDRLWRDDALCKELAERGRMRAASWSQEAFNRRFVQILDAMPLENAC